MSWIRSAMNKAAEVPGGAIFRAAVRTYADTVVQHAGYSVSDATKMFQDRIATRSVRSFSDAAKMLEEASVSCKGEERVHLLRRWLVALREFETLNGNPMENDGETSEDPHSSSDENVTPEIATLILYDDPDLGSSPMNFREVFIQSQALEGMMTSMILAAPNEEEIVLLHELFGLCLTGGREVHDVVVKIIQDLAKEFSVYDGEMLVRREELLQFGQTAITGLKVTADISRIDSEISQIQQSLNREKCQKCAGEGCENSFETTGDASSKDTKEPVAHIQLCCRLKSLLLKKRLLKKGDTADTHSQKVDKLKVLVESLHNSAFKNEKRILEHREEKKEALSFRVTRTSEVFQIEKDVEAEIRVLEDQRDKLEAELRKVNSSLAAANTRLQNAREERLQFDEDNNEFLLLLKEKEDELSKSIVSYRAEADTCSAFINFLEATWTFQSSYVEQRDKQIHDQLQNHEAYVVNATSSFLSSYKDQLEPAIDNVRKLLKSLKGYQKIIDPDEEFLQDLKRRENIEQEYVSAEAKVQNIFDAVAIIKAHFFSAIDDTSRKGVEVVTELFDAIEKIKSEFKKTIKRPNLTIEKPNGVEETTATGSPQGAMILSPGRAMPDFKSIFAQKLLIKSPRHKPYIPLGGSPDNSPMSKEKPSRPDEDASNLSLEFEDGTIGEKPTTKSDQQQLEKIPSALDKESWEHSMVLKRQESQMHEHSTLTGMNTETVESGPHGKTSEPSTGNGKKSLNSNNEITELALAAEESSENNDTTETVHCKTSQLSTEEVNVWEFDELVNDLKDDN